MQGATTRIQSTLRNPPICVQMFHWQCYLVAKTVHVQSVRSQICVYTRVSQMKTLNIVI